MFTKKRKETTLEFIRRSHIELYVTCPYAFYLEVIKKVPVENNIYADVGIMLHEIIDYHSNNLDEPEEEFYNKYKEWFKTIPDKRFDVKDGLKENLYKLGINSIKNYLEEEIMMPNPYVTEETVFLSIGKDLPKIRITMDRINKVNNKLHVIDYKSGKLYVGQRLVKDLQVPTYIRAIQEKYDMPIETFTFLFLSENKKRTYHRINDNEYMCKVRKNEYTINIQERIKDVQAIFARIKQNHFDIPHNINPWHCENMCQYGIKGICAKGDAQRWKKS